jgi:hypothetical protein
MSFLVLHMDKFKKEAARGIQSHNNRERESHSNLNIDYGRSAGNYELRDQPAEDYAQAIQNRIDDLLLIKTVRRDAVQMCGLIVSSDSAFFDKLSPKDTRRFFEESKAFLTEFVGAKNVISAMVHMDEKTPHMHFLHVPVTSDGRLSAKAMYTRESLKKLQTELPRHLQSRGFDLQRGVEQEPGAAKKHLNTREFKQQQEALHSLEKKAEAVSASLEQRQREESALLERLQSHERQAQEAEKELAVQPDIPQASMFTYKAALETAQEIIERQKKALAVKSIIVSHNEKLHAEIKTLREATDGLNKKIARLATEKDEEEKRSGAALRKWMDAHTNVTARLENIEKFFRWNQEANKMHLDYLQEQRREAERNAAEQKRQAQEREQQERRQQEEKERREVELAREQEAQRERERAQYMERRSRGMGMSR